MRDNLGWRGIELAKMMRAVRVQRASLLMPRRARRGLGFHVDIGITHVPMERKSRSLFTYRGWIVE